MENENGNRTESAASGAGGAPPAGSGPKREAGASAPAPESGPKRETVASAPAAGSGPVRETSPSLAPGPEPAGPNEAAPHWQAFYAAVRDAVKAMRAGQDVNDENGG
ncbi:hypothetical protein [Paenibacillus humicola]|uniref:hypothetical protein n=1 Tax=Paenibacillus humicola TaxID=3110540 RepID=UPI00237BA6CA|nr:hypothetical protein [Paenibacillus humicola]